MRIIVWGINYAPEVTGIAPCNTALCEYLVAQGNDVEMLTSFAYYPQWKTREEDAFTLYRTDRIRGVLVHRCWKYVPQKVSAIRRILHEGSFVAISFLRALLLPKADIYVVVSPPLLLGAAAWLLTTIRGSCYHFHVQDLQPDAAMGLNMLQPGTFTRLLYRLEAFAYRHATGVSGIGPGMIEAFRKKNVPENKLALLANGFDLKAAQTPVAVDFRKKHGFRPDDFLAVYSGNLGTKQGLDILIDAAQLLHGNRIHIVICGEGARKSFLEKKLSENKQTHIRLLPLLDDADYRAMLATANVCLITQQTGSGNAFLPSKLLTTLAHRRPVLSVADADSALAQAVAEGDFGINLPPDNPSLLAQTLEQFQDDPAQLERYQENGFRYVSRFDHSRVLGEFATQLAREHSLHYATPGH